MEKGVPNQKESGHTDVPPHTPGTETLADHSTNFPGKDTSANEDTPSSQIRTSSAWQGPAASGHQVVETKWSSQLQREKSQPQDKEDTTATYKDLTGGGQYSADEPKMDPREPFLGRASIDRRVSMGEVIPTQSPDQLLANVHLVFSDSTSDLLAALGDATEVAGMGSYSAEPRPDPREPMSRRSTIDRCISQGIVIPTSPSVKSLHSYTGSSSSTPAPLLDNLKADLGHTANEALGTEESSVTADFREPMSHRASIDQSVSMGKVIPTKPPPGSPVRSTSSVADATNETALSPLSSTNHHLPKDRSVPRLVLAAGLVAFVLALVAVSMLVIRRGHSYFHSSAFDVCDSEDCVQHARFILATLNRSADPCVDFHAHVCGSRGTEPVGGNPLAHAYSLGVFEAIGDAKIFLASNHSSAAAAKAFAAVARCNMDRYADTDVKDFVEFMRERGIPWPRPKRADYHEVLDVLLDLAVNWRVALWFDMTVSTLHGIPIIIIGGIGAIPALRMEQLATVDDLTYIDAVRNLSLFLGDRELALNDAQLKELRQDETAFKKVLLPGDSYETRDAFDDLVAASELTTVFGTAVEQTQWEILLNKYFSAYINISAATKMLILNKQQFGRVGSIIGSLPSPRLLNVIGWTFAYAYAWIVNADFDVLSPAARDIDKRVLCSVAVQESFGMVQLAPIFHETFDSSERRKVIAALSWTSSALVGLMNSSGRLAESTKIEAHGKIASLVSKRIWPPDPYIHAHSLDALYANFSADTKSFFEGWLQSRKALRTALGSPYYASLMMLRYRWRPGSVQYVYALNELWLGLSAVLPPSYLRGGSTAMTYAGLGFQLARQLVRSVDLRGRELDRMGRKTTWWHTTKHHLPACRLDQAKSAVERRLLGDLFALEVALVAMRTSSAQDPSTVPLRLKSLEALTATQTFYVSYCSHHCDGTSGRLMCNLAMNATEFHRTFKCDTVRPNMTPTCVVV